MKKSYRELLRLLQPQLASGVPVKDALRTLPGSGSAGPAAARILVSIDAGATFAEAIEAEGIAPPEHCALLRAGEQSGRLVEAVGELRADLEQRAQFRRTLIQDLAYPIGVVFLAIVLPPLSLLVVSGRLPGFFPINLIAGVVVAVAGLVVLVGPALLPRGSGARRRFESICLAVPFLRGLHVERALGRALWLEGDLLRAGLGFDQSLELVERTVPFDTLAADLAAARDDIRAGKGAADAMARLRGLPPELAAGLAAADRAGRLDSALRDAGKELGDRFIHRLNVTLRVLPIVLYLLAGVIVLRMALAVLGQATGGET